MFRNIPDLDLLLVGHATKVEYVRRMLEMLRTDVSSDRDIIKLFPCCLPHPFSSFYPIRGEDSSDREVDFEARQRSKCLAVGSHNIQLFAVPPTKLRLVYAAALAISHDLESLHWFFGATKLCSSYFLGLLTRDNTSLTSRVRRLAMLQCVVLTIGAFVQTVCFVVVSRFCSARIRFLDSLNTRDRSIGLLLVDIGAQC